MPLLNKLNDLQCTCVTVNLSNNQLTEPLRSVLSRDLGFFPTPGAPDISNIFQDRDAFKRKIKTLFIFLTIQSGYISQGHSI